MIECKVDSGIYQLCPESGTGKTYFYKQCHNLSVIDKKRYYGITYGNANAVQALIDIFNQNPDIVIIDRLDMYITQGIANVLNTNKDKSVILLDLKQERKDISIDFDGIVKIILREESMDIELW